MCIALRYAGTENEEAMTTLKKYFDLFLNMNGLYVGEYAGKVTVESCLVLITLSMSLVSETNYLLICDAIDLIIITLFLITCSGVRWSGKPDRDSNMPHVKNAPWNHQCTRHIWFTYGHSHGSSISVHRSWTVHIVANTRCRCSANLCTFPEIPYPQQR